MRSFFVILTTLAMATFAIATPDKVLEQLHARGNDLKTMAADVKLMSADTELGDADWDTRTGSLVIDRKPDGDTKLMISFIKRERQKRVEESRKDYLLEGAQLIERDYSTKKQITRIVRKPGEKLDLFKLGEGPFPLPIGQSPDEVKKEFDVKSASPEKATPDVTYIELTPKKGRPIADKFSLVTIGVNKEGWPVEVETVDKNQTLTTRALLSNIRMNGKVNAKEFALEPVDDTWDKIDASYRG